MDSITKKYITEWYNNLDTAIESDHDALVERLIAERYASYESLIIGTGKDAFIDFVIEKLQFEKEAMIKLKDKLEDAIDDLL